MQKLTRNKRFVEMYASYASQEQVLVVGQAGSYTNPYFPNIISVDIDPNEGPDVVADAHNLPFSDESYHLILAQSLMAHVTDPAQVMSEFKRVLKPGGTLFFGATFIFPFTTAPHDYWRFTREEIKRLCSGFSSVDITAATGEFTTIGILLERIMLQSDVRGGKITKGILFILSRFCTLFDGLILRSYGNIQKSLIVPEIMTHGYFVVCKK